MGSSAGTTTGGPKRDPNEQALDRLVKRIIAGLFAPSNLAKPELLSGPVIIAIALVLLLTVITAVPMLRDKISEAVFHVNCLSAEAKEAGKEYCDFAIIGFQVSIALVVGGIFVTDKITELTQRAALSFQQDRQTALLRDQKRLMRDLYRAYVGLKRAGRGVTVWNAPWKFMAALSHVHRTYILAGRRIPRFYLVMLTVRFGSAFPKGFYGVLALVVFDAFLLAQIAKGYFDYLAVCQ